jgi:hypothetical protein
VGIFLAIKGIFFVGHCVWIFGGFDSLFFYIVFML